MQFACFRGFNDVVKILILYGAKIQGKEKIPIYWAAKGGHLSTVKLLVEERANINSISDNGETPLIVAARYGFIDVVEYLIRNKADHRIKTPGGVEILIFYKNAYQYAKSMNRLHVVNFLAANGAGPISNF